jgi:transcriptional regulator with XRE-family HTH domain
MIRARSKGGQSIFNSPGNSSSHCGTRKLFMNSRCCASLVIMKHPSSLKRRREAGAWLRELRETAGLTQLELARRLGMKYYAFVSQVETGFSRLPTAKLEAWALALEVDPTAFAKRVVFFYDPELYRLLDLDSPDAAPPRRNARSAARTA